MAPAPGAGLPANDGGPGTYRQLQTGNAPAPTPAPAPAAPIVYKHEDYYTADGRNTSCSELLRIRGGKPVNGTYTFDNVLGKRWSLWPKVQRYMETDYGPIVGGAVADMNGPERIMSPFITERKQLWESQQIANQGGIMIENKGHRVDSDRVQLTFQPGHG